MEKQDKVKEKSYLIKVPVYSSEIIDKASDLFGGISYQDMIEFEKKKLDCYTEKPYKIAKDKRNKTQTREIDSIKYSDCKVGQIPSLLIKVSAYNTNLHDGYVEINERYTLQQSNKLGSENNFFLLYPHIFGNYESNYKHHWLILIYEDPSKESYEIISTVKIVLGKILGIKTANIKLDYLISELKNLGQIPELQIKLSSIKYDDNDVDIKILPYWVKSKLKKLKEDNYKNLPFEDTSDIINDNSYEQEYQKKEIKIIRGKKEYRITREMKEAQEKISETIEEIFNYPIAVSAHELYNIFDEDVMISNFTAVLEKFLSNSDGEN